MLDIIWLCIQIIATSLNIGLLGWAVHKYMRFRAIARRCVRLVMDIDELFKKVNDDDEAPQQPVALTGTTAASEDKRERLAAIVAGGLGDRFLGQVLTLDQVYKMSAHEVEKQYARYETHLGASRAKDAGHSVIRMLSDIAAHIRSQIDPIALAADLEANPNIAHDLCIYGGSLYNRFGPLLTPLSALIITFKHCRFGETEHGDTGEAREHGDTGEARDEGEKPGESCSRPSVG